MPLEGLERESDATTVASRILLALQEPVELQGRRLTVSASIGVALQPGEGGDLLRDADLASWEHPERGFLPPGEFIPVAEESRVICALGRWVLNEACREALRRRHAGQRGRPIAVSVNLSVTQLRQPGLIYEVAQALERSGLEPSRLILEVTETVLMDDIDLMAARWPA